MAAAGLRLGAQPGARTGPLICLYSRALPGIDIYQIATVLNGLGFDGCDLSVQPGGSVLPQQTAVDLVRVIESLTGSGIEVPIITTSFRSAVEPWARNVLYVAGGSGVRLFRPGFWNYPGAALAQLGSQIAGMATLGRAYGMGMGVPNTGGEAALRGLDPAWVGYDFDPSQTAGATLETALPRIKMVLLRDVRKDKDGLVSCPLGEGMVDWPAFFDALARVKFSGPLTLRPDYPATDRLAAIRKDLEFARAQLTAAYQKHIKSTSHQTSTERSA